MCLAFSYQFFLRLSLSLSLFPLLSSVLLLLEKLQAYFGTTSHNYFGFTWIHFFQQMIIISNFSKGLFSYTPNLNHKQIQLSTSKQLLQEMLNMTIFCFNALENPIQVDRERDWERERERSYRLMSLKSSGYISLRNNWTEELNLLALFSLRWLPFW